MTGLNSLKPLQIDDAAYHYYAAQIAEHPLDPYGFSILWYHQPEEANHVLAPPVLPYWWALAIHLFGEQPVLWKLWLLPFPLLFVSALFALFRRFARGLAMPLTTLTALSPVILPGFNLMLDLPAQALSLCSLALFFRASERASVLLAMVAGVVGGLAMQTKYTGLVVPAVMLLHGGVLSWLTPGPSRLRELARLRFSLVAAVMAVGLFAAWEAFISHVYDESHFLYQLRDNRPSLLERLGMFGLPLVILVGGAAPYLLILDLVALKRRAWLLTTTAVLIALSYLAIAGWEGSVLVQLSPSIALFGGGPETWSWPASMEEVLFLLWGGLTAASTIAVACRLLRIGRGGLTQPALWARYRTDWFLVLWLGLELAAFFPMTPFAAVRRIMGLVVVATLLAGRLAARTARSPSGRAWVRAVAIGGAALGLGYFAVDLREAWVRQQGAEGTAAWIRERDPTATIWYVGHWSFQYYAERAGMKPVIPNDPDRPLHRHDWLVVPDNRLHQQPMRIDPLRTKPIMQLILEDVLPLRTVVCYYGTGSGVPLEHHEGPRVTVTLYRVIADHVPVPGP
jgi:hypothetical protein